MKFLFFIFLPLLSFSQVENYDKFRADTSDANHYFRLARSFVKTYQYDSTIFYFKKASIFYNKIAEKIESENRRTGGSGNRRIGESGLAVHRFIPSSNHRFRKGKKQEVLGKNTSLLQQNRLVVYDKRRVRRSY